MMNTGLTTFLTPNIFVLILCGTLYTCGVSNAYPIPPLSPEESAHVVSGVDALLNQFLDQIKSYNDQRSNEKNDADVQYSFPKNQTANQGSTQKEIKFEEDIHSDSNQEILQVAIEHGSNPELENEMPQISHHKNENRPKFNIKDQVEDFTLVGILEAMEKERIREDQKIADIFRRLRKLNRKNENRFTALLGNTLKNLFLDIDSEGSHDTKIHNSDNLNKVENDAQISSYDNFTNRRVIYEDE